MTTLRSGSVMWVVLLSVMTVSFACDDGDGGGDDVGSVEVVYGGNTVTIDLADLEPIDVGGVQTARLSDVVEAADLGVALAALELDFEGSDGFRSSSSSNCEDLVPLPGELLTQGYIELTTRNLSWDEALGFPGCMRVDDTARIIATDAAAAGPEIEVVYGETTATVDLSTLDPVDFGGTPHVLVSDVVEAAELGVELTALELDFEASDGFRPSSSGRCADFVPVAGSDLDQGYIDLATRDLSWDAGLGFPGCLSVVDLVTIIATDAAPAGPEIDVVYGETTATVDLSTLDPVDFGGTPHVLVSDVVEAAELGVELTALELDFEASDGFRPSSSGRCADFVPVAGSDLDQGYIDLATRDLSWDAGLGFPGCLSVVDLVTIIATDAG